MLVNDPHESSLLGIKCGKLPKENIMASKNIKVTRETPTGLNVGFNVPGRGALPRSKLIPLVESGKVEGYHTRVHPNGTKFVASNPDGSKKNNLG